MTFFLGLAAVNRFLPRRLELVGFADTLERLPDAASQFFNHPRGAADRHCGCRRSVSESQAPAADRGPAQRAARHDRYLRADRVGSYGHTAAATPTIDALAGGGYGSRQPSFTRRDWTVACVDSHRATPLGHGFRNNSGFVLTPQIRSAAEDFRQAGYRTAAFVSGFPLDRRFGFDRGFDNYDDRLPKGNDRRRTPYVERFADATTDAVLHWLASRSTAGQPAPWFLWVTTTIRMRHTSRRATSPSVSSGRLTMERSRSWTGGSDA